MVRSLHHCIKTFAGAALYGISLIANGSLSGDSVFKSLVEEIAYFIRHYIPFMTNSLLFIDTMIENEMIDRANENRLDGKNPFLLVVIVTASVPYVLMFAGRGVVFTLPLLIPRDNLFIVY